MEITSKDFWKNYWGEIRLPQKIDLNFKNDRVIAQSIVNYVPIAASNQKALEIGCAPGKWLIFLYEKLGYQVDGFEYLDIAAEKTRENLSLCDIPNDKFKIITADFLVQEPIAAYDLVTSFGFIEHFENYQDIFAKHLQYAKDGAYVVVGFPNFRGLTYCIQLLIDKIAGTKIIENHNILMMDKNILESMIKEMKKEIIFIDYIGGFEPSLFNIQDIKNIPLRFLLKIIIKTCSFLFDKVNKKYLSSYMICIVKND